MTGTVDSPKTRKCSKVVSYLHKYVTRDRSTSSCKFGAGCGGSILRWIQYKLIHNPKIRLGKTRAHLKSITTFCQCDERSPESRCKREDIYYLQVHILKLRLYVGMGIQKYLVYDMLYFFIGRCVVGEYFPAEGAKSAGSIWQLGHIRGLLPYRVTLISYIINQIRTGERSTLTPDYQHLARSFPDPTARSLTSHNPNVLH